MDTASFSFSLVDHHGRSVSEADYHGKYLAVFFGFTRCKLVCPHNLERLTAALNQLGRGADRITPLYISVDPAHDSPEAMKQFLSTTAPAFTGLTGTADQVEAVKKTFRVFAERKESANSPEGYIIPHTAFTYILGPSGQLVDHLSDGLEVGDVVARIQKALAQDLDRARTSNHNKKANNPESMTVKLESLGLLDKEQVASIRHIGNLARQLKGDWSNMMGPSDLHDGFGAYRFQLSYAAYALALAHFHRLPAAPGLFKPTLERIIKKMCEPDVWFYWRDASTGGGSFRTPRSQPNANPIEKDNIMYSAYLQTLVLLYNSLFNDNRYTKSGALVLEYEPYFWGDTDGFRFEYDQNSLNDRVYWNMVESGYLGVACEPWCVFQICNQPPIIGFRLHDELNGGDTAGEVTRGYVKAWEKYGGSVDSNGDYRCLVAKHIDQVIPSPGAGMDAWCATLMHSWNPEFVNRHYEAQLKKCLIRHGDGTLSVKVNSARAMSANLSSLLQSGDFGWVAALASEMGDDESLSGLLAYADKNLSPRIQNGGLTYARSDDLVDDNGNYARSSPIQANALLPLARLNVLNGFQRLYANPWSPKNSQHYQEPALTDVDFAIDVYRAVYVAKSRTLVFDLAVWEANSSGHVVVSRVFERGNWALSRNGKRIAWGDSWRLEGSDTTVGITQNGMGLRFDIRETDVTSYILEWFS
ncbi:hypothetical protein BJY01DRAFT_233735 [Aspergillus pseudoustus]|uniref:Linalool dehydratase/isomerase domain-containing protein n=1 Tax=Aspergillus pseudoustus TaxID=1810923 RepID=A0ABR4K9C0_9EURO